MTASDSPWRRFAAQWTPRIESTLADLIPTDRGSGRLHEAMRYVMFPGGKRLRPLLVLLGAQVAGGEPEKALACAAALECLHTYSLVHDDLPCMDDDRLRRGRPTCHVRYDEATAVLVGDALLTLAFAAVATGGARAVTALARAAGSQGMVGGQQLDMEAQGAMSATSSFASLQVVEAIHDKKTGALITGSLEVGAITAQADAALLARLRDYGNRIGRAFQIADDCLDLTSTPEQLGKGTGQDAAAAKLTYPAVYGLERSLDVARKLAEEAAAMAAGICALAGSPSTLDQNVRLLQDVASYTVGRQV